MKIRNVKPIQLTAENLTGSINISLYGDVYVDETEYFISFICSDKTANIAIVTKLEAIEPIIENDVITGYSKDTNDDNLFLSGDNLISSTTTLVDGGGSIKINWAKVKRFQFTATGIPAEQTLSILVS